jgi:hypothetical protein
MVWLFKDSICPYPIRIGFECTGTGSGGIRIGLTYKDIVWIFKAVIWLYKDGLTVYCFVLIV